jgi:two-component system response regulator ChvI
LVDTFNEADKAIAYFKPRYYDLIILDVRMPGRSGFELAKLIWALDPQARICFMSAFEILENEARKVFSSFKTFCFIKKPISTNALAQHIESHFVKA